MHTYINCCIHLELYILNTIIQTFTLKSKCSCPHKDGQLCTDNGGGGGGSSGGGGGNNNNNGLQIAVGIGIIIFSV